MIYTDQSKRLLIHRVFCEGVFRGGGRRLTSPFIALVSKTEEEIQEILHRKEAQLREKEGRRKKQEENVAQKKQKKDENKSVEPLLLSGRRVKAKR